MYTFLKEFMNAWKHESNSDFSIRMTLQKNEWIPI